VVEEEDNSWYRDIPFSSSDKRSEYKVLNVEGRKVISFCESLNIEMTLVPNTSASVVDYRLMYVWCWKVRENF
jgi:hypothetical protein